MYWPRVQESAAWLSSKTPTANYVGKCMGRGFRSGGNPFMLDPMNTHTAHVVPTLLRMSWPLPWLTTLAISAAIVWAMSALVVGALANVVPAESTPAGATFAIGRACDPADNWQLVYARTTGRVPAGYCPAAR